MLQVGALKQLRETIDQFQHWYGLFDSDQSGTVEAKELTDFLASLGFSVDRQELVEIAWQTDMDGNGYIEFSEFVKVMTDVAGSTVQKVIYKKFQEMEELFGLFDVDGSGAVSVDEMLVIMRSLGQKPSLKEVQEVCGANDVDGNGVLDFGEFVRLMCIEQVVLAATFTWLIVFCSIGKSSTEATLHADCRIQRVLCYFPNDWSWEGTRSFLIVHGANVLHRWESNSFH